jgi:small-conductance mechanosensitive channel
MQTGTVQSMNLIRTTIDLPNNTSVQVPNSRLCDLMISNLSRVKVMGALTMPPP